MATPLLPLELLIISFVLHCSYATIFTQVLLTDAVQMGAVCLDGSPAGYYIHDGTTMPNKWIIHLESGGWCYDEDACVSRTETYLGSSKEWPEALSYFGLLSDDCTDNPYFCGWSMAHVRYCDGASFAGNVEDPVVWNGTTLYFRGFRILDAAIDAILDVAGENIEEVIFSGSSAGGLATYLHVDYFRSRVPSNIPVNAIADAGYFIDAPNINGEMHIRGLFQNVFNMQNCIGGVNQDCVADNPDEEWKCFFAQYTYPHIKTPIFLLNSKYDAWQLYNILQLPCFVPKCSEEQIMQLENFGQEFLEAAEPAIQSPTNGVFIDSCVLHRQLVHTSSWTEIMVGGQNIRDTFYYWLTENTTFSFKELDCDGYQCNPTCTVF